ncbi:uncharacterized protein C16orf95 homolog isoform X2 [Pteropus alecto]|nr:uncharacterized protein C16orf95 homolog isoform X2 [Pteropus alecto]
MRGARLNLNFRKTLSTGISHVLCGIYSCRNASWLPESSPWPASASPYKAADVRVPPPSLFPGYRPSSWGVPRTRRPLGRKWKSTFQTFGKEVCLADLPMCPVPSAVHQDPIFCECQARFGGHLPVPRAEAALPYWVPLTLRPQKQIEKTVRVYIPEATKACPCSRHRFGGRLPMPRDQATMPYWVPRVLRFHKKVVKRQQSLKGIQETPLDSRSWYNRWRICCDGHLLLKWQQLQALHRDGPLALERGANPQVPLLPLNLSFLTFLQAVLRVIVVIRQFFWV